MIVSPGADSTDWVFVLAHSADKVAAVGFDESVALAMGSLAEPFEYFVSVRELRELGLAPSLKVVVVDSFGSAKAEHVFDLASGSSQSATAPNPASSFISIVGSLLPDLVVLSAVINEQPNTNCGSSLPFWCRGQRFINITIRNNGPGIVPAGLTNATVFRQGPQTNATHSHIMNAALGPLGPGGTWFFMDGWWCGPSDGPPCGPPTSNPHTFTITADGLGLVTEANEGNNVFLPLPQVCIDGIL